MDWQIKDMACREQGDYPMTFKQKIMHLCNKFANKLLTSPEGTYPINDAILDSLIGIEVLWSADCLLYFLWFMICVFPK